MNTTRKLSLALGITLGVAALALYARPEAASHAPGAIACPEGSPGAVARARSAPVVDEAPREEAQPTYVTGEWMVRPGPGVDLATVALRHGLQVRRPVGRSGYGAIGRDDLSDEDTAALGEDLAADPGIAGLARQAYVYAAGDEALEAAVDTVEGAGSAGSYEIEGEGTSTSTADTKLRKLQWHLDVIGTPTGTPTNQSEVVVAILDTGVAYSTIANCVGLTCPVAAPSLSTSPIVAPIDLVDGDALPLDVHQHGTHIATIIAGNGRVKGVAPGAALMPIRVLDQNKRGTELDLVEGILHAVDHGADILNMSLSFSAGYIPSGALRGALQEAHDAGILMIAAAGNAAKTTDTWPAASPLVASIGASSLSTSTLARARAPYSNTSKSLDLMAPGGDLSKDMNADGYPDGILAESIALNDPAHIAYLFYAGTSQAAAVTTGAAARLLALGMSPADVLLALQQEAQSWDDRLAGARVAGDSIRDGTGAGGLEVLETIERLNDGTTVVPEEFVAAVYPYLERPTTFTAGIDPAEEKFRPAARIEVRRADGGLVTHAVGVAVSITDGVTTTTPSCLIAAGQSTCTVSGAYVAPHTEAAWAIAVNGVYWTPDNHSVEVIVRPAPALWASDALEILLRATEGTGLASSPLGFYTGFTTDLDLQARTAEGYSVINMGTGLASSPLGLVFTTGMIDPSSTSTLSLNLDGTGLASSPLGFTSATLLTFSGTGLASSPLGLMSLNLLTFDGTGLASSPLGFSAIDLTRPVGATGYDSPAIDLNTTLVNMSTGEASTSLAGTTLGSRVASGGFTVGDEINAAEALVLSNTVALNYCGAYLIEDSTAGDGSAGGAVTP